MLTNLSNDVSYDFFEVGVCVKCIKEIGQYLMAELILILLYNDNARVSN